MDKLMRTLEKNKARSTRITGIHLFRATARIVLNNFPWMLDYKLKPVGSSEEVENEAYSEKTLSDSSRSTIKSVHEDFEVKASETSLQPCITTEMSLEEKYLLFRRPDRRSTREMKELQDKQFYLRCFLEYPSAIRNLLARLLQFVFYKPNRMIVRDGQLGQYIYFIARGTVIKTYNSSRVELSTPQYFGYKSCFHNVPHSSSYETATDCELLLISRKALNYVLKVTGYKREWQKIQFAIQKFPHQFGFWDKAALKQSLIQCQLKKFEQHRGIMQGQNEYTHFIVKGTVGMIQRIENEGNTNLVQVYELLPGTCFNIGEDLDNKVLVATSNVQCVLIPKHLLLNQQRDDDFWYKVRKAMSDKMPDEKTSFHQADASMALKFEEDADQYTNLHEAARKYRSDFRKYRTNCEFEYQAQGQDIKLPPEFYESFFDEENMNLMLKIAKDKQNKVERNKQRDHKRFHYSAVDSLNSSESSSPGSSVSSDVSSDPLF